MGYFFYLLLFMFGASIASFFAVYLERGNKDKFFSPKNRSLCKNCLRKLNFFELIPIFSYIFLRGKCRTCKTKIPLILFIGEFFLGVWFLFSYLYVLANFNNLIFVFLVWVLGTIFYLLFLEDVENMEVRSEHLYLMFAISLLSVVVGFFTLIHFNFFTSVIVPLLIVSPFWLIFMINQNLIGEADPIIFSSLAIFFGTQFTISLLIYSVYFGVIYGLFYLWLVHKRFERNVPFPFVPVIFFSTLFILTLDFHILPISYILLANEILFGF